MDIELLIRIGLFVAGLFLGAGGIIIFIYFYTPTIEIGNDTARVRENVIVVKSHVDPESPASL